MLDEPAILLVGAGKESWNFDEGDDRNVEAVAEADEARGLPRGVAIEHAGKHHRLIGDDADGAPLEPREAHHNVLGEGGLISKKSPSSTTLWISSLMS